MHVDRPLVVVAGRADAARGSVAACLAALSRVGWTIVDGWAAPLRADLVICTGEVGSVDDARRALLAAITGAGLVVWATVDSLTLDRFLDDLRRLGPVDHVNAVREPGHGRSTAQDAEHDPALPRVRPAPAVPPRNRIRLWASRPPRGVNWERPP